jgi:SpoVK/Ycf46/Vps4 family AAA+-type ATPase
MRLFGWFTGQRRYLVSAGALLFLYATVSTILALNKNFSDQGPLSYRAPELKKPLAGALPLEEAAHRCIPDPYEGNTVRIVGAVIKGKPYYACFEVGLGDVYSAAVIDARTGEQVRGIAFLKASGAWPWIGTVKSVGELIFGGVSLAGILLLCFFYYRSVRPGQPTTGVKWWQSQGLLIAVGAVLPLIGWLVIMMLKGISVARKERMLLQSLIIGSGVALFFPWLFFTDHADFWGGVPLALLTLGYVGGIVGGRSWLKGPGFGVPEDVLAGKLAPAAFAPSASVSPQPEPPKFRVQKPHQLPTFRNVGGMGELKKELKETFGLMLAFAGEAEQYRITWNGVLLHGVPGVGKTFIAKAAAGEFGLNFVQISTGDLMSSMMGESARNVREAFQFASENVPCILFFDEFDSIAQRRDDFPDRESRRVVNQLLQSLEEWRGQRELVVVAATNSLEDLDPAAIRAGRFDRHIRIDLPDAEARKAIFTALLKDRPAVEDLGLEDLSRRAEGLTPASIAQAVESAALSAFREATVEGDLVHITMGHLRAGLEDRGGKDRPTVEDWTWAGLVLPDRVKDELRQLQLVVEDPDRARAFGVDPPTGVLLTGPPGTGKTTIAQVLAAQAKCSFYPVSSATVTSMWLGESEKNIRSLFERARENRPSIIFIDEIDSIASTRGFYGSYDPQVNQLLTEIDGMTGQKGVLVIGATNRKDDLDPALLRGGRLSRIIEIPLPDQDGRRKLLELNSTRMPLRGVDLVALARKTEGMSGADLKALCQQAALHAMMRRAGETSDAAVTREDFEAAIPEILEKKVPEEERGGQYL